MVRMKVVGRRREAAAPNLSETGQLLKTAAALRPVDKLVPRGVYRFESFEEASQWLTKMTARTLARHKSTTSSKSAAR